MAPIAQTTPQNLNPYEDPPSIWSNLDDDKPKKLAN